METESPLTTVPVRVQGIDTPVRTQRLPTKSAPTLTKSVTTTAIRIAPTDPYRANITLMSIDQDMYIAFNSASKESPTTMGRWPKNVPFICDVVSEVWVAAVTGTTSISSFATRWAAGE